MKKLIFFLCMMLFPLRVFAVDNDVSIESIELQKLNGNAAVYDDATVDGFTISNHVFLNQVGDYIDYKLLIKNRGSEDYYYSIENNDSPYISYLLLQEDGKTIKAGSSVYLTLRILYKAEVPDGLYNRQGQYIESHDVNLLFGDSSIVNPMTGGKMFFIFFVSILGIVLFAMLFSVRKSFFYSLIVILLLPFTVFALPSVPFRITSNIVISGRSIKKCHYDGELTPGVEYQYGPYTYRYMKELRDSEASDDIAWEDFEIEADGWGVALTDNSYTGEVNGEFCSYINDKPVVSMSFMYATSSASHFDLTTIDSSHVKNMYGMFYGTETDSIDFSVMDTSNVINMFGVFHSITTGSINLEGINTSKVTSMSALFYNSTVNSVDISSWDTSNVESFQGMFCFSHINQVNLLGLNTSKVKEMDYMFYQSQFNELDLSSFDTSSVQNFSEMLTYTSARVGYARTEEDAARLNSNVTGKPSALTFVVKP